MAQLRCPACYQLIGSSSEVDMVPDHRVASKACWGAGQPGWPASFPLEVAVAEPETLLPPAHEVAASPPPVAERGVPSLPQREVMRGDTGLQVAKILAASGGIAALVALASMPIGYYTMLRWLLTAAFLALALAGTRAMLDARARTVTDGAGEGSPSGQRFPFWWVFGLPGLLALTVMFNPVVPIYLGAKEAWAPFDMAAAVLLGVAALVIPGPPFSATVGPDDSVADAFVTLSGWVVGVAILLAMMFSALQDDTPGRPDCDTSYGIERGC